MKGEMGTFQAEGDVREREDREWLAGRLRMAQENRRAQEAGEELQRKQVRDTCLAFRRWPVASPLACDVPAISRVDVQEVCGKRSQNLLGMWNLQPPCAFAQGPECTQPPPACQGAATGSGQN